MHYACAHQCVLCLLCIHQPLWCLVVVFCCAVCRTQVDSVPATHHHPIIMCPGLGSSGAYSFDLSPNGEPACFSVDTVTLLLDVLLYLCLAMLWVDVLAVAAAHRPFMQHGCRSAPCKRGCLLAGAAKLCHTLCTQ
jgi:hypothetical protein